VGPQIPFDADDEEAIFALAEQLTGSCQRGEKRKDILVANVHRRMVISGADHLGAYLEKVEADENEFQELVSALTIHTTSWFREAPHFAIALRIAEQWVAKGAGGPLRVWCAACSTGEEVYSFAASFEDLRLRLPQFDYEILGSDIDAKSVATGARAVYQSIALEQIPAPLRRHFLRGSGPTDGLMVPSKEIRERCRFETRDLNAPPLGAAHGTFHLVVCRNVLIYFDAPSVDRIVRGLVASLDAQFGHLCLGHSEPVVPGRFALASMSNCVYRRAAVDDGKKRILVVDDSATIRGVITRTLSAAGNAVTAVESAQAASLALRGQAFDAITLDVNMPGVDGLTWLREQRHTGMKTPVVVVSDANREDAIAVLSAMKDGAQEFVEKRSLSTHPRQLAELLASLTAPRERTRAGAHKRGFLSKVTLERPELVAIGASTGGTEALMLLLANLPPDFPPVLVVQHLSPAFSQAFAERLASCAGLALGRFADGVPLEARHLYMSNDERHLAIVRRGGSLSLLPSSAPPVSGHRPSVDALFQSCLSARARTLGVLLTGMGRDGARGLADLHKRGMLTCCQDEASSVVFGMPKEAIALGGAAFVGNLMEIRNVMEDAMRAKVARVS
jgi:two-component system chemotaxis response regulator CheB